MVVHSSSPLSSTDSVNPGGAAFMPHALEAPSHSICTPWLLMTGVPTGYPVCTSTTTPASCWRTNAAPVCATSVRRSRALRPMATGDVPVYACTMYGAPSTTAGEPVIVAAAAAMARGVCTVCAGTGTVRARRGLRYAWLGLRGEGRCVCLCAVLRSKCGREVQGSTGVYCRVQAPGWDLLTAAAAAATPVASTVFHHGVGLALGTTCRVHVSCTPSCCVVHHALHAAAFTVSRAPCALVPPAGGGGLNAPAGWGKCWVGPLEASPPQGSQQGGGPPAVHHAARDCAEAPGACTTSEPLAVAAAVHSSNSSAFVPRAALLCPGGWQAGGVTHSTPSVASAGSTTPTRWHSAVTAACTPCRNAWWSGGDPRSSGGTPCCALCKATCTTRSTVSLAPNAARAAEAQAVHSRQCGPSTAVHSEQGVTHKTHILDRWARVQCRGVLEGEGLVTHL